MTLVMTNNIFECGDMYFFQLLGTAIDTSAVCMWVTIYSAVHKNTALIITFQNNLLIYKRSIVNICNIWIPVHVPYTQQDFDMVKSAIQNVGSLTRGFEELFSSANFPDLTISIENNKIITKAYQKSINLYQYILSLSCHPPGMAKGTVTSLLHIYFRQNTDIAD